MLCLEEESQRRLNGQEKGEQHEGERGHQRRGKRYFGRPQANGPRHTPIDVGDTDGYGREKEKAMPWRDSAAVRAQPREGEEDRARDGNRKEQHFSNVKGLDPQGQGDNVRHDQGHGMGQGGQAHARVGDGGEDK